MNGRSATALLASLFLFSCLGASRTPAPPSEELANLLRSYHLETEPYFPFTASENGLHQYDNQLANWISPEYRAGLKELCIRYLRQLRSIDRSGLSPQEQLTFDIFEYARERCVEGFDYPWHLMPIDQAGFSLPSTFPVMGAGKGIHPFKTVKNYEDFLGRVSGFVRWIDTAVANMREGMSREITQPKDLMVKVIPQLEAQIVIDPRSSLFYEPVRNFPEDFTDDDRHSLTEKYTKAIEQEIVPAYRRLRDFIQNEYLPRCRASAGLSELPGGRRWYSYQVRQSTTTNLSSDEIYVLGVREVERIKAQLKAAKAETERGPQRKRYRDSISLLQAYGELRSRVEAALPRLFGRFPKTDFEIRPIEAFREKSQTSSYISGSPDGTRPGVFYVNTAAMKEQKTMYISLSLFLHEALPGHHFQLALQRENKELPVFRRFGHYTAFIEGWGLYVEGLADELGIVSSPRDKLDRLNFELLRAARLVVDVGIHQKGWTRQQAIDYLSDTLGDTKESVVREVERYMAWPGQALAYKVGELKLREIRYRAEQLLGFDFDVRAFHDELLKDGAMPLGILEKKMNRWIAAQQKDRKQSSAAGGHHFAVSLGRS
jgi:uncharacterized protein (DUF885 family)